MKRLKAFCEIEEVEVFDVSEFGLNGSFLEAECFAWLAVRRLQKKVLSVPSTTGCQKAVCGGTLTA
jgi:anhydro-N-acetylmuramic acid kinase